MFNQYNFYLNDLVSDHTVLSCLFMKQVRRVVRCFSYDILTNNGTRPFYNVVYIFSRIKETPGVIIYKKIPFTSNGG